MHLHVHFHGRAKSRPREEFGFGFRTASRDPPAVEVSSCHRADLVRDSHRVSSSLVANEVRIAGRCFVPRARLAGGLDVGHGAQSVGAVKLAAVELLTSGWICGDKLNGLICSNILSEGGVLSVNFGFSGSVPDFGGFRLRVTSVVERCLRMVRRRRRLDRLCNQEECQRVLRREVVKVMCMRWAGLHCRWRRS